MTLKTWLQAAEKLLKDADITSAHLDALILLEFVTKYQRATILAHPEAALQEPHLQKVNQLLARRIKHEPIAYIVGAKEFYGRDFKVTSDVLVPRPESEAFLSLISKLAPLSGKTFLDVGTGSGALAITAKLENPQLRVWGSDVSKEALKVATYNAEQLGADVNFVVSNLLHDITEDFDIIAANLPYVPLNYKVAPDLAFEPRLALYADHGGLKLIQDLLLQTPGKLLPGGHVLIECLQSQHHSVIEAAKKASLTLKDRDGLVLIFSY